MRARILKLLLGGLLVAVPRLAHGAEALGVLSVADPPGPSPDLVELTRQMMAAVAEAPPQGTTVVTSAELRERMTGQSSSASLAELDRAYAGALAIYQNGDFEGAIRTLAAVVEDLEKLPPSPEAMDQWTRAMLRLARSQLTLGRKAEARETLERLLRAAPTVAVDLNQYPPSFVRQVDEVRAHLKTLPQRKLTVNAAKPVQVFVAGRHVGVSAVTLALPAGRYRVSGSIGAMRVPGATVDLGEEDQSVTLDVVLAEALRPAFGPGLALAEANRATGIVAAGAWLGLDKVLSMSLASEGGTTMLVGTLWDVRHGMLQREGRVRLANGAVPAGGLTALGAFLTTGQPSSLVATRTPKPSAPAEAVSGGSSDGKSGRWMGWTATGTALLAIGLGTYAIVEGVSSSRHFRQASDMLLADGTSLQPGLDPARYASLRSTGVDERHRATITGIGAGVSLAATCVFGYLSYRQNGEIGPIRF